MCAYMCIYMYMYVSRCIIIPKSSLVNEDISGAIQRDNPEISTLQLSLRRAFHGTDTVTQPM